MQATLYLPSAAPRPLTIAELAALAPYQSSSQHMALGVQSIDSGLAELLGTVIPYEVLASGPNYLVIAPANAADYDFGPTPSATVDFERLTGLALEEDEPLVGPLLILEA